MSEADVLKDWNDGSKNLADELKQAHDDLDALYVPRDQGGLILSVPGRILLLKARGDIARLAERDALNSIAAWRTVNISGEYEHGLRDIIRSITDCAAAALEASTAPAAQGE